MTFFFLMNLGFAWGPGPVIAFNPIWAANATQVAAISPQVVQK